MLIISYDRFEDRIRHLTGQGGYSYLHLTHEIIRFMWLTWEIPREVKLYYEPKIKIINADRQFN